MTGHHSHSIDETRARSLFKTISGRLIEVSVGTLVFGTILSILFPELPSPYLAGLSLNIVEECLCFVITYGTERVWNRISWGRKVVDVIVNNKGS